MKASDDIARARAFLTAGQARIADGKNAPASGDFLQKIGALYSAF
jgi:hypothetical protein